MEVVEKDLKELGVLIKKKGGFADFLLNPSLKRLEKKNLLISALGGTKASKLTINLLGTDLRRANIQDFMASIDLFSARLYYFLNC